jgi:hypothetical protein
MRLLILLLCAAAANSQILGVSNRKVMAAASITPPTFTNCTTKDSSGSSVASVITDAANIPAGSWVYIIASAKNACGAHSATMEAFQSDGTTSVTEAFANIKSGLTTASTVANGGLVAGVEGVTCVSHWLITSATGNAGERFKITWSTAFNAPSMSIAWGSGQAPSNPLDTHDETGYTPADAANVRIPNAGNVSASAGDIMLTGLSTYALTRTWTADTGWTLPAACASSTGQTAIQYQTTAGAFSGSTTPTLSGANSYNFGFFASIKGQ